RIVLVSRRFVWNESAGAKLVLVLSLTRREPGQLVFGRHLIGELQCLIEDRDQRVTGDIVCRAVPPVRPWTLREPEQVPGTALVSQRAVEPQAVANNSPTEIGRKILESLQRIADLKALSLQLVINVGGLKPIGHELLFVASVEVITAG